MENKVGRNDPCPCGSGKKYKQCCMSKERPKGSAPKKFTAKLISAPKNVNLIERAYGNLVQNQKPASPEEPKSE